MPYSPEQVKTFEEMFGIKPDESSVSTIKGLIQAITTDEAAADAAGIASKADPPAAEEVAATDDSADTEDAGATEFVGDMTPDEFRTFMSTIISDAMAGATMKASVPPERITKLQDELTTLKADIGKPNAQTEEKIADLEKRFKALLSEQPRQVAAAYDPTKDDATVVQTAEKAGNPALNNIVDDVLSWVVPPRA
jgi:polyhydroxyalkanoate synthesis regulator phasin